MGIKVESVTRVSHECDVCGRTSPPQDYEVGTRGGPPDGWRQFGLGKFVKTYCPLCCACHVPGLSGDFTIGNVIDAALELDEIISSKEKQAC